MLCTLEAQQGLFRGNSQALELILLTRWLAKCCMSSGAQRRQNLQPVSLQVRDTQGNRLLHAGPPQGTAAEERAAVLVHMMNWSHETVQLA